MPRIYSYRAASSAYRAHAREVRRDLLQKAIVWSLCTVTAIILCIAEQTSFSFAGNTRPLFPYLFPSWVLLCGWFAGARGGAWFGVFIGLFADAAGGNTVYLLPLVFGGIGFAAGLLGQRILYRRFFTYLFYNAGVCALFSLYRLLLSLLTAVFHGAALPYAVILIENSAREALSAWLWTLPLYWIARIIFRVRHTPC